MWKKNMSPTDISNHERLGQTLTFWYPSIPKTWGITFLRDFLESRGVWNTFIKNFHRLPKKQGFGDYCKYCNITKDYRNIIGWAFNWAETKEGVLYWSKLDDEFQTFLDIQEDKGVNLSQICDRNVIKPQNNTLRIIDDNTINPIYAFLSGATNVMKFVEATHSFGDKTPPKQKKLGFKVPVTATTIFGTSL